jgi:hypothetical protein
MLPTFLKDGRDFSFRGKQSSNVAEEIRIFTTSGSVYITTQRDI